jgi:hypothetical protein
MPCEAHVVLLYLQVYGAGVPKTADYGGMLGEPLRADSYCAC